MLGTIHMRETPRYEIGWSVTMKSIAAYPPGINYEARCNRRVNKRPYPGPVEVLS